MKTTTIRSSILTLGTLWLAATALPTFGQVQTVPGLINVPVFLNGCSQGTPVDLFLVWAEGISGGTASAKTTPAGTAHYQLPCWTTDIDPLMQGVDGDVNTISSSALQAHYTVSVDAYPGSFHCGTLGMSAFYPYDANATLWLASNRKRYVLEERRINPVYPSSWQMQNMPLVVEQPALLDVSVKCPGGQYLMVNKASVVAKLKDYCPLGIPAGHPGSPLTVQATMDYLDPASGGPLYPLHDKLLVRGDRSYSVKISYETGVDPYDNLLKWVCDVPDTLLVPACQKVEVGCTVSSCTPGDGFCFGQIKGKVNMETESEYYIPGGPDPYFGRTVMKAYDGPNGNLRWSRVPYPNGSGPPSEGGFHMYKVMPSDVLTLPVPYKAQGFMNFGANFNFEYFATPIGFPVEAYCGQITDLDNLFVMHPGVVAGTIKLWGPLTPPWALSSLVRYDLFETDPLDPLYGAPKDSTSGVPIDYDLLGSSHVQATGGSSPDSLLGGGVARVLFDGGVGSDLLYSTFSGTYSNRLAALNSGGGTVSSTWQPNVLHLRFLDTSLTPEQHLDLVVDITDTAFSTPQTIVPDVTLPHDLNYCFGEVVITIVNMDPNNPFTDPITITGTGAGTGTGPTVPPPTTPYTVSMSAKGLATSSGGVDGMFRVFLPEGHYTFQTSVQYPHGQASQPKFDLDVGCGEKTYYTVGGPVVQIDDVPPCAPVTVTGSVSGPNDITLIEYWVDTFPNPWGWIVNPANPPFSFTLSSLTTPGTHTILVKATDNLGYVSWSIQTFVIADPPDPQVFNTGMEGPTGSVTVPAGQPDPNFKLVSAPVGAGTTAVVGDSQLLPSVWVDLQNTANSQWIGPSADAVGPFGIYHYQLKFTSCCPEGVRLVGRMAADDSATLWLNNFYVGSVSGYWSWSPVNIANPFIIGVNVLDIYVTNTVAWTGLRAELTNYCVYRQPTPKFVQWPDASTNGLDVRATAPKILADDFLCSSNGAITNIQIWGSWFEDNPDPNAQFMLGIWSDVPAWDEGYSHPGQLLWSEWFAPGQYTTALYTNAEETFYDPNIAGTNGLLGPETNIWWYSFNPTNPFCQTGTEEHPVVYWLSVHAVTVPGTCLFGWKTSTNHWNDDAVYGHVSGGAPLGDWRELRDPRTTNSLDLSFLLNDGPCEPPPPKYVQWPDEFHTGLDVKATLPKILADDFLCTNTAGISNIQIWGSWSNDVPASYANFQLGIWSDVPANPPNPSHPGQLLWSRTFLPGQYTCEFYKNANEWFYDPDIPGIGGLLAPDTKIWRYSFTPPVPFCQQGSINNPVIYWLSVSVDVPEPDFGWKTSTNHWGDDAVFGHISLGAALGDWQELRDPRNQDSLDLSFLLNEGPCISTPAVVVINEWLALNRHTLPNTANAGRYDGWFELYNPSDTAVVLGGYYLTDDLLDVSKFRIPAGFVIAPHGYLLVWGDNNPALNQSNSPDLHVNFSLAGAGESLGLFASDGTAMDSVNYGAQTIDLSEGRYPDGATNIYFMPTPTPRLPNVLTGPAEPRLQSVVLLPNNSIQITLTIATGSQYQVQYTDDLNAPGWIALGPPQTAAGPVVIFTDSLGTRAQRFYRVVVP